MKQKVKWARVRDIAASLVLILFLGSMLIWLLTLPTRAIAPQIEETGNVQLAAVSDHRLTSDEQDQWLERLSMCESGGNQNAINAMDLDGTASYGKYQFKPGTWKHYVTKYDLWNWREWEPADWKNTMMSGIHQDVVLQHMVNDAEVDFSHEFPACTRRLGLPPK